MEAFVGRPFVGRPFVHMSFVSRWGRRSLVRRSALGPSMVRRLAVRRPVARRSIVSRSVARRSAVTGQDVSQERGFINVPPLLSMICLSVGGPLATNDFWQYYKSIVNLEKGFEDSQSVAL